MSNEQEKEDKTYELPEEPTQPSSPDLERWGLDVDICRKVHYRWDYECIMRLNCKGRQCERILI